MRCAGAVPRKPGGPGTSLLSLQQVPGGPTVPSLLFPIYLVTFTRVFKTEPKKNLLSPWCIDTPVLAHCAPTLNPRPRLLAPVQVGAALLCGDADRSTVTGCNVENASYGLTVCAERTAVVKAVSDGLQDYLAVAIAADLEDEFVGPCGMCRWELKFSYEN